MVLSKWDICLAKVKFEDNLNKYKVRPVLVIEEKVIIISYKITSHEPRNNFNGEYTIINYKESGLVKKSTIRLYKCLNIPKKHLIKKIGRLSQEDINNVINILNELEKV